MNCIVDAVKLVTSVLSAVVFAAMAYLFSCFDAWVIFILCAALAVVYAVVALINGRVVRIDTIGVRRLFPVAGAAISWTEIREVGVAGVRLFHAEGKRRTGVRYIYFSTAELNEQQRFQMCLSWPPKDIIYLRFSYKKIAAVQALWKKDVHMLNTGDLRF